MSCKSKQKAVFKAKLQKRNAAQAVAKTRNGGFIRHKNDRRAKDARNDAVANNQENW